MMNNRNANLASLIEEEQIYNRLITEEWNNKISIYTDMLFSMEPNDFIDFLTGSLAYVSGLGAAFAAITPLDAYGNICIDPAILARDGMTCAGLSMFFGALHMLYRYQGYNSYALESANRSIEHYQQMKLNAVNRRYTLFPESNKSHVSSAAEYVWKFVRI